MDKYVKFILSEDWYNFKFNVDFSEDFWVDPIKRTDAYMELSYQKAKLFPNTEIGSLEPKPDPIVSDQYGHRFIPALFGCKIKYSVNQAPSAEAKRMDFDEMAKLDIPNFYENEVFRKAMEDYEKMKSKYGFAHGWINTGSPLNAAISIFGEDFIAACACEPEIAQHVLMIMAKTFNRLMYEFTDKISPQERIDKVKGGMGNCPAIMFSPTMYEDVILPIDLWYRKQFKEFSIHHCGILDKYNELYTKLYPTEFDIGGGSNYKLMREYFPDAICSFIVNPEFFEGKKREEIDNVVRDIITNGGPHDKISFLYTYGVGRNATDENIMDLYSSIERLTAK